MNGSKKVSFEFGDYRLIPDEQMLSKNGVPVQLPNKAFEILVVLVENAGELVEKQQLLELVWKDSFVEEANIQVHISAIRKALNDKDNGKFVETVPRRGYRFIADVRAGHRTEEKDARTPAATLRSGKSVSLLKPRRPALFAAIALGAVGLAVISIFSFRYFRSETAAPFQKISISKATNSGNDSRPAISPDGTNLAYQRTENGRSSLWVVNIPTGAERQLTTPIQGAYDRLAFSPEGDSLFITQTDAADPNKKTTLYELPVKSGDAKPVIDNVDGRVTFSPDGKQIAFVRIERDSGRWDIIIANRNGGEERILTMSYAPELIRWPAWSPKGDKLAAFKMNAEADKAGNRNSLVEVDVQGGSASQIGHDRWSSVGSVVWVNDGTGLVFTASRRSGAPMQIWYLDYGTGASRQVTNDTNSYYDASVDKLSGGIAAVMNESHSAIWISDILADGSNLVQITTGASSNEGDRGVTRLPDGRVLYTATTQGNWDIWLMKPDGTGRKRLTTNDFLDVDPIVTPDGTGILYTSQVEQGYNQIWKMAMDGGEKTQITNSLFDDWPAVTPDGQWVIYTGGDSAKEIRLRKISIDGGEPTILSSRVIRSKPTISPDGKLVAFASYEPNEPTVLKIMIMSIDGGEPIKSLDAPVGFMPNSDFQWSPDGNALTYRKRVSSNSNLWNLPIDGSPPVQGTHFDTDFILRFNWSADGKLSLAAGQERSDIVLVKQER